MFSPDGRRLASSGFDQTVKLWEIATDQESRALRGHTDRVWAVAFSPDGRTMASASEDRTLRLWDTDTGQVVRTLRGHTGPIYSLAFAPNGRRLATGGTDATVRVWDAGTGKEVRTLRGHAGLGLGVAFGTDSRRLASTGLDGTVRLWDAETGQAVRTLRGHAGWVAGLAFSPDGRRLATAGADAIVRLWDADTGKMGLALRGHTGGVLALAFNPDGRRLASAGGEPTGGPDRTVRVWDVETGKELRTVRGQAGPVWDVAFSPDGRRLATAGGHLVKLWDADTGQPVLSLPGHAGSVGCLAFSPDGRLLAAGVGQTVTLWDASPPTPERRARSEARDLVQLLFGLHLSTSEVRDRIRDHPSLDAAVRRRALDLAGPYGDRLLDQEAERVVGALYNRPLLRPEVLASLRADAGLSEPVRQRALALAEQVPESPYPLNTVSWQVVRQPGAAPGAYDLALRQAEVASRLVPGQTMLLNTLGVAQYRAGQDRAAVATLSQADRLNTEAGRGSLPADLAFLALAHHRLGDAGQARAALGRLRALMKRPEFAANEEFRSFLREAEAIELDLAFPADPFAP
jgi:WD40 repeat protein